MGHHLFNVKCKLKDIYHFFATLVYLILGFIGNTAYCHTTGRIKNMFIYTYSQILCIRVNNNIKQYLYFLHTLSFSVK